MNTKVIKTYQDWDKESVPLKATGKEPKFIKPPDKFSGTEGDNVFTTIEVTGDPIVTVEWFRVSIYLHFIIKTNVAY